MNWYELSNNINDGVSALDTQLSGLRDAFPTTLTCPSCSHHFQFQFQGTGFEDWRRLPAGVKFDPSDEEILKHLEAKVKWDKRKLHPFIHQFIPTLEEDDGICYTHPQNLPGMRKDGVVRHFFHRPSKAYTAGTRKRRKVQTEKEGTDTRWHKTGKTRPVVGGGGVVMGFKKILVLYTNNGNQMKPQKTNWIMHQYHLGVTEHEKDGQFVASKVFFQNQPRRTLGGGGGGDNGGYSPETSAVVVDYGNPLMMSSMYEIGGEATSSSVLGIAPHFTTSN